MQLKMIKHTLLLALIITSGGIVRSQTETTEVSDTAVAWSYEKKTETYLSSGIGIGDKNYAPLLAAQHDWRLGKRKRIVVGTGLRFITFFGSSVTFTSAPADLASNTQNGDSIFAPAPFIYSVNTMINLGFQVNPHLMVGFNIDLFGASFGPNGSPDFVSNGITTSVKVNPTSLNILLVGDNDQGSLNSQFYGRYQFTDHFCTQLAFQFLFSRLTSETKIQTVPKSNDRFRAKSQQIYLGLNYLF